MADSDGRTESSSTGSIAVVDGVTLSWQEGGNSLKLRCTDTPNANQMLMEKCGKVICKVTPDGRVIQDDIDITNNDSALAECFIQYLEMQGVTVNRGS